MQKVHAQLGRVQAQQGVAAGCEQVGQAAHEAGVVFGGDEAALLVAGWVHDDEAVGAAAGDLAPAAENVVRQKAGPGGDAVELVVLLANGHGAVAHVHIDHLFGPTLQCHH